MKHNTSHHHTKGGPVDTVSPTTNMGHGKTQTPNIGGAELPPADTKRWVSARKAQVVTAVRTGIITLEEACKRYALSIEEFVSWQQKMDSHGLAGLRVTHHHRRRG